ncbi:MAG: hypothetical protein QGI45_13600 [Myxococcota bacterium]|jgi:hypothetical protein|nr:hypothetical protein [Myxococcota bacterium]
MKALISTALTLSLMACGVDQSALILDQSANIAAQEMSSTVKKDEPQKSKKGDKGEKILMKKKPTSDQTSANTDTTTEEELVCCKTDMGNMLVPASECDDSQLLPAELCEEEELICCQASSGDAQWVPESECDVPVDEVHCVEDELCCQVGDEFLILSETECAELGISAEPERCEEEEICCKDPFGNDPELMTLSECIESGSAETSMDACEPVDELVCCHTLFGMQILPASECEDIVEDEYCDEEDDDDDDKETCCRIDNGFVTMPLSDCEDQGGTPNAPADLCEDSTQTEEELFHCCYLNNGLPTSSAAAMSPELCEEDYQGLVIPNNSDGMPQYDDATQRACQSLKSEDSRRESEKTQGKDQKKNNRSIGQ